MRVLSIFTAAIGLASSANALAVNSQHHYKNCTCKPHIPSLAEATLAELSSGLAKGLFTSVDLVNAYTARIGEVQDTLKAVTEINPDALAIAEAADERRSCGTSLGPLDGIPVLIKNNIATDDKMNNTAGSFSLLGAKVPQDSTIAAKLRAAGVVILGKSNLSQWANFRSYNSSNGWSAHGGQVTGAYYPEQDPSGSSSGSGVASSIGLAWACLGSETSGSIISPSSQNNLVGIKPTVGLTSRFLVVPISEHQDTVGPMARTVADAAYLLQAIAGADPNDNYTSAIPSTGVPDYVKALNKTALKGARLGVAYNMIEAYGSDYPYPPVRSAFSAALNQLVAAGATLDSANFTGLNSWLRDNASGIVLDADFNSNLPSYLSKLTYNPTRVTDLADVTNFTQTFPAEEYPSRDTGVFDESLDLGYGNTDPRFWPIYQRNLYYGGEGGVLGALERGDFDAIVLPSDVSPGNAALVGSPIITVPLGFYPANQTVLPNSRGNLVDTAPGVPFGLSFMGRKFDEAKLIGLAYAYEQLTMHRLEGKTYIAPKTEIADVIVN